MSASSISSRIVRAERTAATTLESFARAGAAAEGVRLASLAAIDQIQVRTRNSLYQITMLGGEGDRVLVLGGAFFPVWTETRLSGSTLGGSFLKMGWVGCGFCMEFLHEGQRIVTTRVREIRKVETATTTVC